MPGGEAVVGFGDDEAEPFEVFEVCSDGIGGLVEPVADGGERGFRLGGSLPGSTRSSAAAMTQTRVSWVSATPCTPAVSGAWYLEKP